MREIKFRAKEDYGIDRWLYAKGIAPVTQNGTPHGEYQLIQSVDYEELDDWNETTISSYVIPKTIGQYTGLKDTKGIEIYEDDILELDGGFIVVVEWCNACFYVNYIYLYDNIDKLEEVMNVNRNIKVIGNIHDNPELLNNRYMKNEFTNNRKINPQITEKGNKMSELIAKEDLYQAVKNLQEYIDEDIAYQSNNSVCDFDDFCINHCKDIAIVLSYVKNAYELLNGEKMEDKQ